MCHDFQNLLGCSDDKFIPSLGETSQKGSHMGSLVHMSQAALFLFCPGDGGLAWDCWRHTLLQVYVKSYQATTGGRSQSREITGFSLHAWELDTVQEAQYTRCWKPDLSEDEQLTLTWPRSVWATWVTLR